MERLQATPINSSSSSFQYSERGTSFGFPESGQQAYLLTSTNLGHKIPFLHTHKLPCWQEEELLQLHSSPIFNSETKDQNQHPNECNQMAKPPPPPPVFNEIRRKRKRLRPTKNKEEVESQRMSHIAVERNRRRQMNDHLNVIQSLIPTSYIQRGDQASIIGGAIDFVKALEQLLKSLEAGHEQSSNGGRIGEAGVCAHLKSQLAEIEVTMIQAHVNLKIRCPKAQGQLLKAIVAFQDLSLTVLHLNITTTQATATMHYSFNLKIEDECKLGSAEQIAATVHQIFNYINDGRDWSMQVSVADHGRTPSLPLAKQA